MSESIPLIMLMCSERSGSNFVTRLFDAHPEVCGPAPVHLVRLTADHALRYGPLDQGAHWRALVEDLVALFDTQVATWRSRPAVESLMEVEERTLTALLSHIYAAELRATGKQQLFLKENHSWRFLPMVFSAFPTARVLLMVRDPRDMALSWKRCRELRGDVVRAAGMWKQDQHEAMKIFGQLRLAGRVSLVRYEELTDRTEEVLQRACSELELDYHPDMLGYHRSEDTRSQARASASWENVARPPMTGNHAKFHVGLSEDEVRYVEHLCAEEMRFFGYSPVHPPADDFQELEARLAALERHDKPGWAEVPEEEKAARSARVEVVARMTRRPIVPPTPR